MRGSKCKDYPDGNAAASWKRLKGTYMPDTAPTMTQLHQEFYSSKLKPGYDPDIWMTKLEFLRIQLEELDYIITDDQFMVHIINNLTKDYGTLVDILGRRLGKGVKDKLEIEQLRQELNLRYERLRGYETSNNNYNNNKYYDNQDEKTMYAGQKFKGRCRHCGVYGHKAAACWERNPQLRPTNNNNSGSVNNRYNNNNGNNNNRSGNTNNNNNQRYNNNSNNNNNRRFNGKCNYCGIIGHKDADCNKKKREQNQQPREKAAMANESDDYNNSNNNINNDYSNDKSENNYYSHQEFIEHIFMAEESNGEIMDDSNQTRTLHFFFQPNMVKCEYCNDLGEIGTQCNNCTLKDYTMMTTYDYEYERQRTLSPEERVLLDVMDSNDDDEVYRLFRIIADVIDLPVRGKEYYMHLRLRLCKALAIKTVQDLVTKSYNMYCSDEIIPENEISDGEFQKILKYGALWLVNQHQRRGYDSNPDPNEANYTLHSEDETWDTEAETTLETTLENDEISLPVMVECEATKCMALKSTQLNIVSSRKDLWIADSEASCHMTNSKHGMINLVKNNSEI